MLETIQESNETMRIVLDAMGTDDHPVHDVAGGVMAAREWDDEIILVGDEDQIQAELDAHDTAGLKLEVVHASQVIEMTDEPATAARAKKDASIRVGMNLVRDGQADAFVSAGNTGGILAVATLHSVRRIPGVKRPAVSAVLPLAKGQVTLLDVGANADCRPEYLYQFGVMGSVYTQRVLKVENPRVALLSNGEEPGKGNTLVKEAYGLLQDSNLNFVGNVEGKELIAAEADVVVADGFTGNIALKTIEAVARMLNDLIRDELMSGPRTILGGLLARPAFSRVAKQIDPFEVGGAPLLGVNGIVIIGHGRSNAWAVRNAIRQARLAVEADMIAAIKTAISEKLTAEGEMETQAEDA
jgi:glycerol-3-phosphate acyltransferase PlsX